MNFNYFMVCFLLGVGLSMDACAISMANGLNNPELKKSKMFLIAFAFGFSQAVMPLIGYFLGHATLSIIGQFIPWIALVLLSIIGGNVLYNGIKNKNDDINKKEELTFIAIIVQAFATSIDALSTGLTIANYSIPMALVCALIIGILTFTISMIGIFIGKKFGLKLKNKAEILGGLILIFIGFEIFLTGIL